MRRKVISVYAFLFVIFLLLSSNLASEILNCTPRDFSFVTGNNQKINVKNPVIQFKYNRSTVGVYIYPSTPSVNLFINQSEILVKGIIDSKEAELNVYGEKLFATEVLGIANINVTDYGKGLKDCEFFIADKSTGRFFNEFPIKLDAVIFQLVEHCITLQLCPLLGHVQEEDLVRARMDPRDFGPMSIWSRTLQVSFPKMIPPKLAEHNHPKKRANLIEATDSIIKIVANNFKTKNNGLISIPDMKGRLFSATKGTFEGLENLQRDERVPLQVSPSIENVKKFAFAFGVPQGYVKYADYRALGGLLPFVGSLCADVYNLIFTATISMDFSQKYCRPSLIDFNTTNSGNSKSYACGRLSLFVNPFMSWFLNAWDTNITQNIERQIEWAMAAYIYDTFDCENFRPNKNNTA